MSVKKIGLVRQRYTPFGGAERIVARSISALHSAGWEVQLFTREWSAQAQEKNAELPDAVSVCNPRYLTKVGREKSFAEAVHAAVHVAQQRAELALVQTHERIPGFDIYRAGDGVHATWLELSAQAVGKDHLLLRQRLNPFHHYLLKAERALFTHAKLKAVICNSHMVQQDIHQRFGLPLDKLPIIRNGVDSSYFQPAPDGDAQRHQLCDALDIPAHAKVFLMVGSGFSRKGVGRALAAWPSLPPNAYLVIVGDDRQRKRYQQAAKRDVRIHSRIKFVGPQTDVRAWYHLADCFLLPTLYDPFPNAALEAMASGLPVITTSTCGAAEWLTPQTGWVVPPTDARALQQALAEACALSHVELHTRGAQARALVTPYSLERFGQELQALYERLPI